MKCLLLTFYLGYGDQIALKSWCPSLTNFVNLDWITEDGLRSTNRYTVSPRQTQRAKILCLVDSPALPFNGAISAVP